MGAPMGFPFFEYPPPFFYTGIFVLIKQGVHVFMCGKALVQRLDWNGGPKLDIGLYPTTPTFK
jgi:hypothetical protein